ncbi:MAG: hypothetical protein K8R58_00650, partial [Bacteroidales bacterium]|nr:hypothetical protein [Bacteroidales bacterium]
NASTNNGWKNVQFAIGMNRYNNFNNRMLTEGVNYDNSLIDTYVEYANGIDYDQIEADYDGDYAYDLNLAWWTYLIDTLGGPTSYIGAAPPGGVIQNKSITSNGSMNELVISMGANYNDRLYLGATFGFPYIRYFQQSYYTEKAIDQSIPDYCFREFSIYEDLVTKGSGFNFKFGMIFRATDWVRIGGAIHTPTFFFNMTDKWNTTIESKWDVYTTEKSSSPNGRFDYELTTPMRAIGSLAFIIGKYGLISADYEYVDYSEAKFRSDYYSFFYENNNIRKKFTSTGNLRVGTEWRLDMLSLRGGYSLYGNPFKSGINDGEQSSFSFGLGFREKNFFIDLAYVHTISSEDYYLYGTNDIIVNPVKNDFTYNNFLLTLGFRY